MTATGGTGDRARVRAVDITVTVTNVDVPGRPAAPTVSAVQGSTTSLAVSWTAPDGQVTSYSLQYKLSTVGSWTDGPQGVTGTSGDPHRPASQG